MITLIQYIEVNISFSVSYKVKVTSLNDIILMCRKLMMMMMMMMMMIIIIIIIIIYTLIYLLPLGDPKRFTYRTVTAQRSFYSRAVSAWNSLTADTRNSPSLCAFRRSVKHELRVQNPCVK